MEDRETRTPPQKNTLFLTAAEAGKHLFNPLHPCDPVAFKFPCQCSICIYQTSERLFQKNFSKKPPATSKKHSKGFTYLLEKLGEISQKASVKLNIPDTIVFKAGKAVFSIQQSRDRCLNYITSSDKLNISEVIKMISNASKVKKREEISQSTNKVMLSGCIVDSNKESACLRYMQRDVLNDAEDISAKSEEGAIKILTENDLIGLFWKRSSSIFWKQVAYIQCIMKCKQGIGESFIIDYTLTEKKYEKNLTKEYEESDILENQLLAQGTEAYSIFICDKLQFLFAKYLNISLQSIQGEFIQDENGKIWLIHATNISTQAMFSPIITEKTETSPQITRKTIDEDLLSHLAHVFSAPKNSRTVKISQYMQQECDRIFAISRIKKEKKDTFDIETIAAYHKLRPFTPIDSNGPSYSISRPAIARSKSANKKTKIRASRLDVSESIHKKSVIPVETQNSWIYIPKVPGVQLKGLDSPSRLSQTPLRNASLSPKRSFLINNTRIWPSTNLSISPVKERSCLPLKNYRNRANSSLQMKSPMKALVKEMSLLIQ